MKQLLILASILIGLPAFGQSTWRNFFTTNQNPIVEVVAGSNATVQASTVGVNLRRFTVNSTASGSGGGQTNWPWQSITNISTVQIPYSAITNPPTQFAQTNISWIGVTNLQSSQMPFTVITNAPWQYGDSDLTNWGTINTNVLSTLGQTNISYLSVTNAPWITNNDTRQISFATSLEQTNGTTGMSVLITNGSLTIIKSNLQSVTGTGLELTNVSPAASGLQQFSPSITLSGNGWKSDSSATRSVRFRQYVTPIQGTGPTATWGLESSIGGLAFSSQLSVNSSGQILTGSGINLTPTGGIISADDIASGGSFKAAQSGLIYWNVKTVMQCQADGTIKFSNAAVDGFSGIILGPVSNTWPTLLTSTNASGPLITYSGILKTSGQFIKTNAISTWPTAPLAHGDTFIGSSNGVVYALYSGLGLTWLKTNLISGP